MLRCCVLTGFDAGVGGAPAGVRCHDRTWNTHDRLTSAHEAVHTMPEQITGSRLRVVNKPVGGKLLRTPGTGVIAERLPSCACPQCGLQIDPASVPPLSTLGCQSCGTVYLVPGRIGSFVLQERIGEGEMGEIYRAVDETLHRDVAIKMVCAQHASDQGLCERLRAEAQAAAKLSHPGIAQVFALGFLNGLPYLVMELVRGEDLAAKLRREHRIDERTALRAALDVTEGLIALHREGLTHGDIKPGNIVLGRDGRAKLVDFGLSGLPRSDGTGMILGTPHYIAPELIRGGHDSVQSDIYSLGATLYHILAGQPPFDGPTPADVVRARLESDVVPLGQRAPLLSMPTQQLVARMLKVDPARRYAGCEQVAVALQAALSARGLAVAVTPPFEPVALAPSAHTTKPRHRTLVAALGLVALVELVVAVGALLSDRAPRPTPLVEGRQPETPETAAEPEAQPESESPPAATGDPRAVEAGDEAAERDASPSAVSPDVGPDEAQQPVLRRLVTPLWESIDLGGIRTRGSTIWREGTLVVQGEGQDLWNGHDACRYVSVAIDGSYELTLRVVAVATTHPFAKSGIFARSGFADGAASVFFGFQGDGILFLQARRAGRRDERLMVSETPYSLPCHLRLQRRGDLFRALVSDDGAHWELFAEHTVEFPRRSRIGVATASRREGVLATAEFAEVQLLTPDGSAGEPESTR